MRGHVKGVKKDAKKIEVSGEVAKKMRKISDT